MAQTFSPVVLVGMQKAQTGMDTSIPANRRAALLDEWTAIHGAVRFITGEFQAILAGINFRKHIFGELVRVHARRPVADRGRHRLKVIARQSTAQSLHGDITIW